MCWAPASLEAPLASAVPALAASYPCCPHPGRRSESSFKYCNPRDGISAATPTHSPRRVTSLPRSTRPALPKPHQAEDVGSWRTDPFLPRPLSALQLHPHGVQQPLPVGNLVGPHDVEEGRTQSVERLSLIGDLWAQSSETK